MKTTRNIKVRQSRRLGLVLAVLAFLPLLLWRPAGGQTVGAQTASTQTTYIVTDLGTLGGTLSVAIGLNNRGQVSGFSTLPGDTATRVFLWQDGLLTDLGTLGGPNSAAFFPLINDSGEVAGVSDTSTPNPLGETCFGSGFDTHLICLGFVWREGVITALPTLGGYDSAATEVSNLGQVAGFAETTTPDPTCVAPQVLQFRPVIWGKGEVQELPTLPGDPDGQANAINDNGQVVGVSGDCEFDQGPGRRHAVLWQGGSVTDLGNLGGTMNNLPTDINNQGQVVGLSDLPGDTTAHAFLWQNGVMADLGTLPGDVASGADSINSKNQVTGGSSDASGNGRAFLWQSGVMTDLNTLIPAGSPLFLLEATSINSRGAIAGIALQISTGEGHAFLATPTNGEAANESTTPVAQGPSRKVVLPENVRKLLRGYGHARMKFLTLSQ